jgi:indole-3-glycerol phosphate synthase
MSILDEIYTRKRDDLAEQIRKVPLTELRHRIENKPPPPDFLAVLHRPPGARPRLIAEVKKASPSRGILLSEFDPLQLAHIYQDNGAAAVSILTEERYFQGSLEYLRQVSDRYPRLPLLRKDFLFDPYQLFEAREAGASAILLIAAMLSPIQIQDLIATAGALNLTALVEVHDENELAQALSAKAKIIGINNRNLKDLRIDLAVTHRLRPMIPAGIPVVSESGIHSRADVDLLTVLGLDAILVGEALVTAEDIAAKVRELAL